MEVDFLAPSGLSGKASRISTALREVRRVIATDLRHISLLQAGISGHAVFLIDSSAGEFVLKVYASTGHSARENETLGLESLARWGVPAPKVVWQSAALDAAAFSVVRGSAANSALRDGDPQVIGAEIGSAIAKYSLSSRTSSVRCVGPISNGGVPNEVIRYTLDRAGRIRGKAFTSEISDLVVRWHHLLTPPYASSVTFDSKLAHFIFEGTRLVGVIDLEHWDTFDPAVDVGDLLHSLQESNVTPRVRQEFFLGLAQGLGELFSDILVRLPFYIARRYLIEGQPQTQSGEAIARTGCVASFWLTQRLQTSSRSELVAAVASAPTVRMDLTDDKTG